MSDREQLDAAENRAILQARTRALAKPLVEARDADAQREEVIVLRVAGTRFAISPRAVLAVAALRKLTPLPHAPAALLGLTSREGDLLPVFDLRVVLGLGLTSLPEHGRIVIVGEPSDPVGLVVEAIEGSADVGVAEALPATTSPVLRAIARGVTETGLVLLDHEALLSGDALVVKDTVTPRA
jgi:purine-binding chemotaxis protein CheW